MIVQESGGNNFYLSLSIMSKKSIFVVRDDFPAILYDLLKETFEVCSWNASSQGMIPRSELLEKVKGKFALICHPSGINIDKEVIEAAGSELKVISTVSAGFEHIDVKEMISRGIKVGHTPDVLTEAVAEHAIGLLIATGRRILEEHRLILKGDWNPKTWSPTWLCGYGLNHSTVGIIGCGRIGLSILKKVKAFKPSLVFYYNRSKKPEADELGAEQKSIDFIMKECDFILVSLAFNANTKGLINKERINSMKKTAVIVNISRGALIDESALIEALQNENIGGAGLDVFTKEPLPMDSPLMKFDNVVLTPHVASATFECKTAMAELAALNVLAVFNEEKMPAAVDEYLLASFH